MIRLLATVFALVFLSVHVGPVSASDLAGPSTTAMHPEGVAENPSLIVNQEGLWSIDVKDAALAEIFRQISERPDVAVVLLDPLPEDLRITIMRTDVSLEALVAALMQDQKHGGSAIYKDEQGRVTRVYIATREGVSSFASQAQEMFARIEAQEKIEADALFNWLRGFSEYGMALDPSSTGIAIGRVLWFIHENFPLYRKHVLELFGDQSESSALRYAMLEVASMHFREPGVRDALLSVFGADPDSLLQSRVAWALAEKGEQGIGDTVVQRYPASDSAARFRYAHALATLGRADALDLLLADAQGADDFGLRKNATEAAIRLAPDPASILSLVQESVEAARATDRQERTQSQVESESIAMGALKALGAKAGRDVPDVLLAVAGDSSASVNVRLTALEALRDIVADSAYQEEPAMRSELGELKSRILESSTLDDTDKVRFESRFRQIQESLDGVREDQ